MKLKIHKLKNKVKLKMSKKLLFIGTMLGLSFANAQTLYGLTRNGSTNNYGVLFSYELASQTYIIKKSFGDNSSEGATPRGSLILVSNKLYGMTYAGGANNAGTLFEYDPGQNTYNVKHSFGNISGDGILPSGSLIQTSNGKFYGMTSKGGAGNGTLFEYDPATENYAVKVTFNGANGNEPQGGLVQASNGKLYGMTYLSATVPNNNRGVLFEYDAATENYTVKIEFDGNNGSRPYGDLVETNGKLYGMTREGGTNGAGTLFEFDPTTAVLTKKVDFGGANGRNPMGTLCMVSNGKFYGLASGGNSGSGLIFEYDPTSNIYATKADFDYDNGSNPMGSLMQSSNGKLYGLSSYGGSPELGTMFSFDISSSAITKLVTFDGTNGSTPYYTKLLEVTLGNLATTESSKADVKLYPNPVADVLYLKNISKANVSVYNMAGQQMLNKTTTNGQLNLSSLAKGVYIVKVEADGKISSHKVVKK